MLDQMQRRRKLNTTHTLPLPLVSPPAAPGVPLLLLGVISGDAQRRRFLRRAWVAELNAGETVRVRFVVGAAQPDAEDRDVLTIAVPEHQLVTGARELLPKKFAGLNLMGAWTWTQYAKVTGWLRYAATQPEPLVGKCDEDVLVVPPMLEAYAALLRNLSMQAARPAPGSGPGAPAVPAQVFAGVFEWYSWAPATLACKAWGREHAPASFTSGEKLGADAECSMYTCNCSSTGGGWTFDGWDLSPARPAPRPRDSFAARAAPGTCVGPQAFARGALKIMGAGAVRWLVGSRRFASDTRYAAELLGGVPPSAAAAAAAGLSSAAWDARLRAARAARASRIELSEDAQLGYWLARHPSLHYVHLALGRAYLDVPRNPPRRESALAHLLVVHKLKTREFGPTRHRAAQLWRRAREITVHSECTEQPPCDPGGVCAHQVGQRVCSLYATLVRDPLATNATLDALDPPPSIVGDAWRRGRRVCLAQHDARGAALVRRCENSSVVVCGVEVRVESELTGVGVACAVQAWMLLLSRNKYPVIILIKYIKFTFWRPGGHCRI